MMVRGNDCKIHPTALFFGNEIEIGNNVRIDAFCVITGDVKIGNNVHIACGSYLFGQYGIEMHDFSGLSARVTIYSASDDYSGEYMTNPCIPDAYKHVYHGRVVIGRHAIIGCNATIMPSVKICEGVAIGAYSFVKSDCRPWSIYTGVPAAIVRNRSMKLLEREIEWRQHKTSSTQPLEK